MHLHTPLLPSQQVPRHRSTIAAVSGSTGQQSNARLQVVWASSAAEVRDAQRLRYRIFVEEMGARPGDATAAEAGLDRDRFDAYCDHLLVRLCGDDGKRGGAVIGTYRVLSPGGARRAGGFYSDGEFDLSALADVRRNAVELGRACVHPAWRSGSVIMALWSALGQYMLNHSLDTMIGCASISLADGGGNARALWQQLRTTHLAAPRWQVQPHNPLRLDAVVDTDDTDNDNEAADVAITGVNKRIPVATPPLIKGYLRCGARLLGPPAYDAAFNTADLPMMMRLEDLAPRYRQHFLGS